VAQDRLRPLDDGRIVLTLKSAWVDGTRQLLFEPLELLEKLAALIPRPRINLVLYHGGVAPHSSWRARVVAYGAAPGGRAGGRECSSRGGRRADDGPGRSLLGMGRSDAARIRHRRFGMRVHPKRLPEAEHIPGRRAASPHDVVVAEPGDAICMATAVGRTEAKSVPDFVGEGRDVGDGHGSDLLMTAAAISGRRDSGERDRSR